MKLSWIFVIILFLLVAIFSVQNAELVTVRFIVWQFSLSSALVIQIAALLGALVGLMIGAYSVRHSRHPAPREPGRDDAPTVRDTSSAPAVVTRQDTGSKPPGENRD